MGGGVGEVGRGPWAGPLVVGAVVLGGEEIEGLTDSKKLSKKRREELDIIIRERAKSFGLGWVEASEIDQFGLAEALKVGTVRAVGQIQASYQEIIIDGTVNFLAGTGKGQYVTLMKKADLLVPSVSAASIIAKVARDNFMTSQDEAYPGYNFKSHAGYGTLAHRQAIDRLGVSPLHRLSFAPLKKYFTGVATKAPEDISTNAVTTKQTGDRAEDFVADKLTRQGHDIIARNWRTRLCEIDIISMFNRTVYFTEVKYRKSVQYGDGLDAITAKKSRQMKFAAELFILKNRQYEQLNQRLQVASLAGEPIELLELIEIDNLR